MKSTRRILVIGDIHDRVQEAETILSELRSYYDHAVLLGDVFDSWNGSTEEASRSARWLAKSLRKPERIHLLGNHDLPYLFPHNLYLSCPGFTEEKLNAIKPRLKRAPLFRLRLAYYSLGWLFSHAGFGVHLGGEADPETLVSRVNSLLPRLSRDCFHPAVAAGHARGGSANWGGVTWLDWLEEFQPIPGIHQMVGHTVDDFSRGKFLDQRGLVIQREFCRPTLIQDTPNARSPRWQSMNFCLDVRLEQVALIDRQFVAIFPPRKDELDRLLNSGA